MRKFYVIGNGFDKHYGLSSDYDNFKEFIKKQNSEIVDKVDDLFYRKIDLINEHPSWGEFESMLRVFSDLDYDEIYDEAMDNAEDDMDRAGYWDSPSFNVDYYNDYIDVLKDSFDDWILSLDKKVYDDHIFHFDQSDYFITFNYTMTLEKYFNINPENILHIHGDIDSEIILGHNDATEPYYMKLDPWQDDYRVTSTCEKINALLKKAAELYYKDSKSIVEAHKDIFDTIGDYDDVLIIGLSCGTEDEIYIKEIAKRAKHITFYHYVRDDNGLNNFELIMEKYNNKNYKIIDW